MVYVKTESRKKSLEQDFISKCADRWGEYEYLGGYENKDTKVWFRHNCGYKFLMSPHNFRQGHGCPECAKKRKSDSLKRTKGNALTRLIDESNGEYTLIEYRGSKNPAVIKHSICGNVFTRIPSTVNQKTFSGMLCTICSKSTVAERYRYTLAQANERLSKVNKEYSFISYAGATRRAVIKHLVCEHIFTVDKAGPFLIGNGHCPKCTTNISKQEREIYEWMQTISPSVEQSVHDIPGVTEIDIFDRERKVGIEYNGHFWHSAQKLTAKDEKTGKPRMTYAEAKKYHYLKTYNCEQQGIRLIHIWDYEWADPRKQKVLKNIILGALGILPERYYARQCEVKRYDRGCPEWQTLNNFFEENNIQGNRGGSMVFTLEKDGRILMAYKFGRPSGGRAKKKYEYEMVRGASAPGVQVVGGASKLWKHFMDEVRPKSVVYYIDYNYFDGRSVEKLGGRFVGSQPGVKNYWVKTGEVKNREPARHSEVKKAIENGECLELWNAGTKTYEFINSDSIQV